MLIETNELTKVFRSGSAGKVLAVDRASVTIARGETVGLFGECGSGKSTLGMLIVGLHKPTSGQILFHGKPVFYPFRGTPRRKIQILFQHPEVSFNPVLPLITGMVEPYRICKLPYSRVLLNDYVSRFGLRPEHLDRVPSELSGGELQRAALARVLLMEPELLVLDEPTSMLDVITQAQMITMLEEIQEKQHTAFLFITHDRALCEHFCNRIYSVEKGIVLEETK